MPDLDDPIDTILAQFHQRAAEKTVQMPRVLDWQPLYANNVLLQRAAIDGEGDLCLQQLSLQHACLVNLWLDAATLPTLLRLLRAHGVEEA